ncbi:hypothetical protein CBS101457_004847 [Exobasidium rhododendri]|nr:hypothetical protein CBS101457_004847 [Exobasidium rhododendri]
MAFSSLRSQHILVDVLHIIEIILIHGVLGISAYRRFNKSIVTTRGDFISMSAAAKSLMFIFWILSE